MNQTVAWDGGNQSQPSTPRRNVCVATSLSPIRSDANRATWTKKSPTTKAKEQSTLCLYQFTMFRCFPRAPGYIVVAYLMPVYHNPLLLPESGCIPSKPRSPIGYSCCPVGVEGSVVSGSRGPNIDASMEMTLAGRSRWNSGLSIEASMDAVLAPSGVGLLFVYAVKPRFVPCGESVFAVDVLGPALVGE